ncbi:MAG: antibiotic biosynthesis monooxygenase [Anaerolineae bacterium]|nr:antibiotic biosynthesis monooxygenase [Anaerolineae bacterium]
MYGLMGKIRAQDGQRESLLAHLLEAARLLNDLETCYLYVVSRATDDPEGIWVTEVWRSQADHQASLTHEAIRSLIAVARPLIAGMSDRTEFAPAGGKGLPADR